MMNSPTSHQDWQFIGVFLTVMLMLSFNAQADNKKIYAYQDENGNTVFTDKAKPNAKEVDVRTNIMTLSLIHI